MLSCPSRRTGAAAKLLKKKRKLPATFYDLEPSEAKKKQAVVRIQRFLRWRRTLATQVDPIRQERIPPKEAVILLETGGVEHWYSASSLASYFIATACFCNPLSRRPLWCWEVNRILQMQPRSLRPLITATYKARFALQKDAHENDGAGLASSTEETLDANLQSLLSEAEMLFFDFRVDGFLAELEEYEENLRDLVSLSAAHAKSVCLRHREVAYNRGIYCPGRLAEELKDIQDKIVLKRGVAAREITEPMPILKVALLRRLEFK